MRNDDTSCASCGSKGVGEKVSAALLEGVLEVVFDGDFSDGLRPVNLSQIDIGNEGEWTVEVGGRETGSGGLLIKRDL